MENPINSFETAYNKKSLNIWQTLEEAWKMVHGTKLTFFILYLVSLLFFKLLLASFPFSFSSFNFIASILMGFITLINYTISFNIVFKNNCQISNIKDIARKEVFINCISMLIITNLILFLSPIISMIIGHLLIFFYYIVLDKSYSNQNINFYTCVKEALVLYFSNFFFVVPVMILATIIGSVGAIITLSVGLIWAIPFMSITPALIYSKIRNQEE